MKAVSGTSSDTLTIATVEKLSCEGRLSTAEVLESFIEAIAGFCQVPENIIHLMYRTILCIISK